MVILCVSYYVVWNILCIKGFRYKCLTKSRVCPDSSATSCLHCNYALYINFWVYNCCDLCIVIYNLIAYFIFASEVSVIISKLDFYLKTMKLQPHWSHPISGSSMGGCSPNWRLAQLMIWIGSPDSRLTQDIAANSGRSPDFIRNLHPSGIGRSIPVRKRVRQFRSGNWCINQTKIFCFHCWWYNYT